MPPSAASKEFQQSELEYGPAFSGANEVLNMSVNLPAIVDDGDGFEPIAAAENRAAISWLKWTADTGWTCMNVPLPERDQRLIATGTDTIIQRWRDGKAEKITAKPLPDLDDLNASVPVEEWELDFNNEKKPPYSLVQQVYLLNVNTGEKFIFASSSLGATRAKETLQDRCATMRMLRGARVYPEVELGIAPWPTRYGMKTRPHFKILNWVTFGDGQPETIPADQTPPLPPPPAQAEPAKPAKKKKGVAAVEPASMSEILNDELPDDLK
jgi:hypothetical protein